MEKGGKGSLAELSVQENGLTLSAVVQIALTVGLYSIKGTAKKPALPWHTANARRNHFGAKRPRRLLPPDRRPKNPPDRGCKQFRSEATGGV